MTISQKNFPSNQPKSLTISNLQTTRKMSWNYRLINSVQSFINCQLHQEHSWIIGYPSNPFGLPPGSGVRIQSSQNEGLLGFPILKMECHPNGHSYRVGGSSKILWSLALAGHTVHHIQRQVTGWQPISFTKSWPPSQANLVTLWWCSIHRETGGIVGMVPLIINPIYTLYSGHLLCTYPILKGSGPGILKQRAE